MFRKGQTEAALEEYMKILAINPDDLEVRRIVGNLSLKLGNVTRAITHFEMIGRNYAETRELARAIAVYKRVVQFDPDNESTTLKLADLYREVGLNADAKPIYLHLAELNRKRKNFDAAHAMLETTARLFPSDKEIQLRRLDVLCEAELLTDAERVLKEILSKDPDNGELLERLGKIYIQKKKFDEAYALFSPAVENLINSRRFEEAAAVLRIIISAHPDHLPSLSKMAAIFKKSGKTNRLLVLYESMLAIYKKQGMKQEIRETLQELAAIADTPSVYMQQLKRMNDEDRRVAEEEKKRAEEKEWVEFQLKQADISIAMRNFTKAADMLKKTKIVFPDNLDIREKLFHTLRLSDDVDNALKEGAELLKVFETLGMNERYFQLSAEMDSLDVKKIRETDLWKERTGYEIAIDFSGGETDAAASGSSLTRRKDTREKNNGSAASKKTIKDYMQETDFYLNEGYLDDAERLLKEAERFYPGDKEVAGRLKWVNMLKKSDIREPGATHQEIDIEFEEPE